MSSKTNWYVFTGAPSSGVSTTLAVLADKGFKVLPEAARDNLDEWRAQGFDPKSERRKDEPGFQHEALKRKIQREQNLPTNQTLLFDRGVPDSVPYFGVCGLDTSEVLAVCASELYRRVFFFEALPWTDDYGRTEDSETRTRLAQTLKEIYVALGYEVISVPVMSPEERAEFVLSHIDAV